MQSFLKKKYRPTYILRHRKENLKKCSLTGLESRSDMEFYRYPITVIPDLSHYVVLAMEAPLLTIEDIDCGLLLIDATWRYAEKMNAFVDSTQKVVRRSLPGEWRTAYPRKQEDCPSPERGLASVEALFVAYHILGRSTDGMLDSYYWKDQFLAKNASL